MKENKKKVEDPTDACAVCADTLEAKSSADVNYKANPHSDKITCLSCGYDNSQNGQNT